MNSPPNIQVLSYDDLRQRRLWRQLCDSFEVIDIFFYPEYCRLFELHGDGKPYLFVYYDAFKGKVIYPFLKRSLHDLVRGKQSGLDIYDITSPYGYTGYLRDQKSVDMNNFYDNFHAYCQQQQIISEFIRFNPLLENASYAPFQVNMLQERETVFMDLKQDEETLWLSLEPTCRNKIRKAHKNNVSIIEDSSFSNLEIFFNLYTDTMKRLNAHSYYFFSKDWFSELIILLQNNVKLFHACYNGNIINSAFFIFNNKFINYFLSGSLHSERNLAANNILLYEVALWAKKMGIEYFHLGGGYKPNDSLSRFKASFSPLRAKYYIGGVIHQSDYYNYLCDLVKPIVKCGQNLPFFPLYRQSQEY